MKDPDVNPLTEPGDADRLANNREVWRHYLTTGDFPAGMRKPWYKSTRLRPWVRRLPSEPRCRICYYPFEGVGGFLSRVGRR